MIILDKNIGDHANMLVYDKKLNSIERFEPHGIYDLNDSYIDTQIKQFFESFNDNVKYISPKQFCPKFGPQYIEDIMEKTQLILDRVIQKGFV